MSEVNMLNHTTKVNKVVLSVLSFISLTRFTLTFIGIDTTNVSYVPLVILLIGVTVSAVFVYKKVLHRFTSFILTLSFLINMIFSMTDPYITGMTMILGICISAIYLDKLLLINFGSLSIITFIIMQMIAQQNPIVVLTFLIMTTLVLFFVCKWGSDLIKSSAQKEAEAKELLNSLDNVVKVIQENTSSLNKDISSCNEGTGTLKEISSSMSVTVQEITKGVMEQSESINSISQMIKKADEKMSEMNQLSKELAHNSSDANKVVLDGSEKIKHLDKQMEIINTAVRGSIATVQELNGSMDKVNSFLSSITRISEQTNLLALNAAIEAARAGESGKGFAVVADEVRKLAEQSSSTVKEIDKIVDEIKAKTNLVLEKVSTGSTAVKEGEAAAKQVNEGFESIKNSFRNVDKFVTDEIEMAESISLIFKQIYEQAEVIARVAEEHSAAAEEMLATTEEQDASIESIHGLMQSIKSSSIRLQELIEKR